MIKAVIFDLDGVIVSTDHFHFLAWKKLADRLNIYFDEKINEKLRGVSRKDSLEIILKNSSKEYSLDEKEQFLKEKNDTYVEYISSMTKRDVDQEIIEILKYLEKKGIKKAIGSSSKNTMKILTQIELLNSFDAIVDGNMIKNSKPDPEVFLKAADKLLLSPDDCLVVEDAEAGIDAAASGNFKSYSISSAYKYHKATYTSKYITLDEIKNIVDINNK